MVSIGGATAEKLTSPGLGPATATQPASRYGRRARQQPRARPAAAGRSGRTLAPQSPRPPASARPRQSASEVSQRRQGDGEAAGHRRSAARSRARHAAAAPRPEVPVEGGQAGRPRRRRSAPARDRRHQPLEAPPRPARHGAEHVFGGEPLAQFRAVVPHASRHRFKRSRLRRSQLLTVRPAPRAARASSSRVSP